MAESPIALDLAFHSEGQMEVFKCASRYVVVPCGRRYGKTEGAFRRMVSLAVQGKCKQLWVDTTQSNIERYFGVYLEPILKPIAHLYKWNKQLKVLKFQNGSIVHFGSAEKPENLEGFGYDCIWLNEAGHILGGPKGERLWSATILPMTIEGRGGKGAQVFFLGTPKDIQYGPGLFRKLAARGEDPEDTDVSVFKRSSYDNPHLTDELIREIFEEVQPNEVRQEVYGEFEDQAGRNMVIPYQLAQEALHRVVPLDMNYWPVWGLDVFRGGADCNALAKRRFKRLLEPVKTDTACVDGNMVAEWVAREFDEAEEDDRPKWIMVDEIGYGSAALDAGRKMGLPMRGVNVAKASIQPDIYYRKRDELWFAGRQWLETASLNGDEPTARELTLVGYGYQPSTQKKKVESKDELKRLGHASPNRADALLLALAQRDELKNSMRRSAFSAWRQQEGTWQSL